MRARSPTRPVLAVCESSTCTGPLTGSGSAATAQPSPAPSRARDAGPSARPPPATSTVAPLCPHCLIVDPANHESCVACGRRRPVGRPYQRRAAMHDLPTGEVLTCSICGRDAACSVSTATGRPWCEACKQRWARCAGCGQVRPVRGGSLAAPLCATCTRPEPSFWRLCPTCGQNRQLRSGPCTKCVVRERLRALLADQSGEIRSALHTFYDNLANYERPTTVLRWLDQSRAPDILRELSAGRRPLTHAALDELADGKPVTHLRSILVATGALPPRDEQMARTRALDQSRHRRSRRSRRTTAAPRLRGVASACGDCVRRLGGADTTHGQAVVVQQHVRAAIDTARLAAPPATSRLRRLGRATWTTGCPATMPATAARSATLCGGPRNRS